jgi:hypothetical protein
LFSYFYAIFVFLNSVLSLYSLSVLLFLYLFLFFSPFLLYIPLQYLYPLLFVYTVKASNIKMQVWLPVVGSEDCDKIYREKRISIGNGQLCAGGVEGKDSCVGDSGGPIMSTGISSRDGRTRYFMAGIVSFGPESGGTKDWPGVYTRVSHYTDWILNQLAE